jgi:cobalt/nickel transport system permease protein
MHIPDGYLSPQTCGVLGAASAVTAAASAYKTAKTVKSKYIPLLSIGAAFSFVIMMFNIPIPDGTTAHGVGGALLAVVLGPWAAFVSVSIALIIQALFFGDGGILALGANIFNMAFVLPFSAYFIYQWIAGNSAVTSKRRRVAAAIAGFVGLNLAALCAGAEFGLQPLLFHAADGTPLYSPYGLGVAIPAMAFAHVLVAGPVEGVVSGLVVAYLQKTNPTLLSLKVAGNEAPRWKKLAIGLGALILLSPLGLLASGTAWGEWGGDEIKDKLGYIPNGMAKFSDHWKPLLFPDYGMQGWDQRFWQQAVIYIGSAVAALVLIVVVTYFIGKLLAKGDKSGGTSGLASRK